MGPKIFLVFSCTCLLLAQSRDSDLQRLAAEGDDSLARQDYTGAERAYESLRKLAPSTAEVYAKLGVVYFQERKFDQAIPVLRQALKLKPTLPRLNTLLAMSLSELGQFTDALPGLEKAFRQPSTDAGLKRMCGLQLLRTYTGLSRDRNAVDTALELNRMFPNDAEVLYQTGRIYGNFAYLTMHKLSEVAPESVWRHQAAGEAWDSQGSYDLAIQEYRQVLQLDPSRPGIHFRLGRVFLDRPQQNDPQGEALKEFQEELDLDPTNANAAYEIGEIYRKAGQIEKASQYFTAALVHYPDFAEAHLGLAATLISGGKPEAALPHLKRAVALEPGNPVGYYRLAQVYKALGDNSQGAAALVEFQRLRAAPAGNSKDTTPSREVTKQEVDANATP